MSQNTAFENVHRNLSVNGSLSWANVQREEYSCGEADVLASNTWTCRVSRAAGDAQTNVRRIWHHAGF